MIQSEKNKKMGFKKAVALGWKNLFNFRGEACRSEHWWWVLFVALFILTLMVAVVGVCLLLAVMVDNSGSEDYDWILVVLFGGEALCLFLLPLLLISSQIRRFRDVGKTAVVPVFGLSLYTISLICLCCFFASDTIIDWFHIRGSIGAVSDVFLAEAMLNAVKSLIFNVITIIVCLKGGKLANFAENKVLGTKELNLQ